MTREEAIYRLKNTAWLGSDDDREEAEEAVVMAIKALEDIEKWRTWSHTYDNLISKKFIQEVLIERISNLNAEGEKSIQTARELIRFKRFVDGLTPEMGEVVRCKDCKHRHEDECPMYWEEQIDIDEGDGYYDTEYIIHDYTQDDGFCSWGERRTDD